VYGERTRSEQRSTGEKGHAPAQSIIMRCRGTSAGPLLRRWTAAAAACLVACALRPAAWARAVTGGLTTAHTDYEYFRGDLFPELVNPSPVTEPEDNDRRRHEYRCTDCVDDQEPDAYERRMHEHRCADCETEPEGSLSTAAYKRGGGGHRRYDVPVAAELLRRRWPPTAVIGKRRDHRHRVVVPPTRRRHRPVVVTSTYFTYQTIMRSLRPHAVSVL